jgi:hypothetical protein
MHNTIKKQLFADFFDYGVAITEFSVKNHKAIIKVINPFSEEGLNIISQQKVNDN